MSEGGAFHSIIPPSESLLKFQCYQHHRTPVLATTVLAHNLLLNSRANTKTCSLLLLIGASKECEHLSKGEKFEKVVLIGYWCFAFRLTRICNPK